MSLLRKPTLAEWRDSNDKDNPVYFQDAQFRADYTEGEMSSKVEFAMLTKKKLREYAQENQQSWYSVLSLGCGPGSDLVGVAKSFRWLSNKDRGGVMPHLYMTGVDKFDWNWNRFKELRASASMPEVQMEDFVVSSMQDYVRKTQYKFDIVIMNFANAKDNWQFILDLVVPRVLKLPGRMFVIDNWSNGMSRLMENGFKKCAEPADGNQVVLELK